MPEEIAIHNKNQYAFKLTPNISKNSLITPKITISAPSSILTHWHLWSLGCGWIDGWKYAEQVHMYVYPKIIIIIIIKNKKKKERKKKFDYTVVNGKLLCTSGVL